MRAATFTAAGLIALASAASGASAQLPSSSSAARSPAEQASFCFVANDHLANTLPKSDPAIPALRSAAKQWYATLSKVAPKNEIADLISNSTLELASRMSVQPNPSNDALTAVFRTSAAECQDQPEEKSNNG